MLSIRIPLSVLLTTALALPAQVAFAAQPADPSTMTDEQKMEQAKALFGEGNAALEAGDYATATQKFEDAYLKYAPNLHVFNFNIGNAAFEAGDCIKAKQAFQRFLDLVPEHGERGTAQEKLMEIEQSQCAAQQAAAAQPTPAPTPTPAPAPEPVNLDEDEDAPILSSRRSEREAAIESERNQDAGKRASGLLVAGGLFTGLGAAAVIGGGVSLALANKKAKDLADAASPGEIGFPEGNYADSKFYDLDRKGLPNNNIATVALFAGGGAMLATGIALIVVDVVRKKKASGVAKRGGPQLTGVGPSLTPRGVGAAASVRF